MTSPLPQAGREPAATPSWVRWLWDTPWLWLVLIVAIFCVPLFIGLDRKDLDNDEAIYSFAVETMLKDGDWLTPKSIPSESRPFFEKPPLKLWITYVPMRLGLLPDNEFGLRFMDAAMGALAFLYVFGIGRKLAGPLCGTAAVLLLFCQHALLYEHGIRSNNMESSVVLAYAAGIYHFLAWRSVNPDVKRHVYAMAAWFAFGFMTKFAAALFLPVVLAATALIKRQDRGRLYRDWPTFLAAALFAIALIAPWFVYQQIARAAEPGPKLFDVMFGTHVFRRMTGSLDAAHLHPWTYYFSQIWSEFEGAGTQVVISIGALLFLARTWLRRSVEGAVVVLWFVIPMAAISAGTGKLFHYSYPFLAPLALAGGWLVAFVAARLYRWLASPLAAFTRRRDSTLPGWLTSTWSQMALTLAGFLSLVVLALTLMVDRVHVAIGTVTIRNSSAIRPAVMTMAAWLVGAPPQILRAAIVAAVLAVAMPLSAYHANVARTTETERSMHEVRACLSPIMDEQVAIGRKRRGTWVETASVSWTPFYYLRSFGAWQEGGRSTPLVAKHLLSPDEPQFVLLSEIRYHEVLAELSVNRESVLAEAARFAGTDPAALADRLERQPVGLVAVSGNTLLLPGPFAVCGHDRVQLISR
jgi:hypothetical protein